MKTLFESPVVKITFFESDFEEGCFILQREYTSGRETEQIAIDKETLEVMAESMGFSLISNK